MPDSLDKTTGDSAWVDAPVTETEKDRAGLTRAVEATDVQTDGTRQCCAPNDAIICFSAGTGIQTPHGDRRIETLGVGDHVITRDNGSQAIRWIGRKTVRASGALAPIRFAKGTMGNYRDLLVSPQHRMLFRKTTGSKEILIPAKRFVDNFHVTTRFGGMVTYVHMLFDRHQVVYANGAPSESFYPSEGGLETLTEEALNDVFTLFPSLRSNLAGYGPPIRELASRNYVLNHAA